MKYLKNSFISGTVLTCFLFMVSCSKSAGKSGSSVTDSTATVKIKYIDTLAPSVALKHAGGLINGDDIARIKSDTATEPWKSGWAKLCTNSHAQTTYTASPTTLLIRGGNSVEQPLPDNYSHAMNDVAAAYQLGIRWKITGDATYAQTAVNILNAWSRTCTGVSGDPNVALGAGIYGYEFAVAGEQLRDYTGWAAADFAKYQQWMLNVFYPINYGFLSGHFGCNPQHTWSNWDLCNLASLMGIGILTDNRSMYNYAINYIQKSGLGNGYIFRTIPFIYDSITPQMAQMQESGRDQGHATLSLALLTTICQLAWGQGDDLWGFNNNMVLKASEYTAKYNIAFLGVPYTSYSWYPRCDNTTEQLPAIGSASRGTLRSMWAMIYNHYAKIKNVTASNLTYTAMGVQRTQPEGGGGDYGSNSGGFDQLGFGTLLYSR